MADIMYQERIEYPGAYEVMSRFFEDNPNLSEYEQYEKSLVTCKVKMSEIDKHKKRLCELIFIYDNIDLYVAKSGEDKESEKQRYASKIEKEKKILSILDKKLEKYVSNNILEIYDKKSAEIYRENRRRKAALYEEQYFKKIKELARQHMENQRMKEQAIQREQTNTVPTNEVSTNTQKTVDSKAHIKKVSNKIKYCLGICAILCVLYLVGIADLDYGYYTFLRIFSLIALASLILAYMISSDTFLNPVTMVSGVILILFNPIFPIYLDKDVWGVLDIISSAAMLGLGIYIFVKHIWYEQRK